MRAASTDIGASSRRRNEEVGRHIGRLKDYCFLPAYLQEYVMDTTGMGPVLQEEVLAAVRRSDQGRGQDEVLMEMDPDLGDRSHPGAGGLRWGDWCNVRGHRSEERGGGVGTGGVGGGDGRGQGALGISNGAGAQGGSERDGSEAHERRQGNRRDGEPGERVGTRTGRQRWIVRARPTEYAAS